MLSDSEPERMIDWVKTWAKTGPLLEQIHRRELREMTYEQRIKAIDAVLDISGLTPLRDTISGLVEQQRLFKKVRA
jgi:hypothetical protein